MRPRMSIRKLLQQLPPEEELLRSCLERAHSALGNSLGPVDLVHEAEDVRLGLIWRKRGRGVNVGLFPTEILAIRWKEPYPGEVSESPEVRIDGPEDLLPLLEWLAEAPKPGELDYP
jgi:hypothetical protein